MAATATLNYLNGVQSYYSPAQAQQQSASNGGWMPSVHTPLVVPTVIGGGGGGHSVNVIATDPTMLREIRQQQQEDNENSRATTAAVIGGIGTIIFAGLSALALRGYCDNLEELQRAHEYKNDILPLLDQDLRIEMTPIVNEHIRILEKKTGMARNIIVITGLALATAATAFVAGMLAVQWLITAAIITTVALAAIGVFLLVWQCTDKTSIPPEMQEQVARLRAQLSGQEPLNQLTSQH